MWWNPGILNVFLHSELHTVCSTTMPQSVLGDSYEHFIFCNITNCMVLFLNYSGMKGYSVLLSTNQHIMNPCLVMYFHLALVKALHIFFILDPLDSSCRMEMSASSTQKILGTILPLSKYELTAKKWFWNFNAFIKCHEIVCKIFLWMTPPLSVSFAVLETTFLHLF